MIRLSRVFFGNYAPNYAKLTQMKYALIRRNKSIISITSADHGFGQIKGTVRRMGVAQPDLSVVCFREDTRQLLWETKTDAQGKYTFRNLGEGLTCFVVLFDPVAGAKVISGVVVKQGGMYGFTGS